MTDIELLFSCVLRVLVATLRGNNPKCGKCLIAPNIICLDKDFLMLNTQKALQQMKTLHPQEQCVHFAHYNMRNSKTIHSNHSRKKEPSAAFAKIIVAHYYKVAVLFQSSLNLLSQTPSKPIGKPLQALYG